MLASERRKARSELRAVIDRIPRTRPNSALRTELLLRAKQLRHALMRDTQAKYERTL